MGISASDVIPLSHARATFSELAEEVKAGAEKIITKGLDDVAAGKVKDARSVIQSIKRRRSE